MMWLKAHLGASLRSSASGTFPRRFLRSHCPCPDPLDRQINLSFNSMILIELLAAFRIPLNVTYFIALRHSKLATLPSSFPGSGGRRPNTIVEAFKYVSLGKLCKRALKPANGNFAVLSIAPARRWILLMVAHKKIAKNTFQRGSRRAHQTRSEIQMNEGKN